MGILRLVARSGRIRRLPTSMTVMLLSVVSISQTFTQIQRLNLLVGSTDHVDLSILTSLEGKSESPSLTVELIQRNTNFSRLPGWYHDYVEWHRNTLGQLNETNWSDHQYVLLRCVKGDDKCFGTSDRLKMVPVMVLMAAQTDRLFFIHWSRPAPLEEFLLPNQVNWTVPEWLHPLLNVEAARPIWRMGSPGTIGMYNSTDHAILRIRSMVYAHSFYDEQRSTEDEPRLWDIYHEFWHALFIPSPPIQNGIDAALRDLDLYDEASAVAAIRPYVSVHLRTQYVDNTTNAKEEENAIRCASHLQTEIASSELFFDDEDDANVTQVPIFVASDTSVVTQRAVDYGRAHNLLVLGRPQTAEDPWHLDRNEGLPEQFYDTFVDLYLLSLGECYTWGRGGYGSWAAAIGNQARGTCPSSGSHHKAVCEFASA